MDEGFILDKRIGIGQPRRIENAKILVANTPMDTDKIKIYGARVRVDSMQKVTCGSGNSGPPYATNAMLYIAICTIDSAPTSMCMQAPEGRMAVVQPSRLHTHD